MVQVNAIGLQIKNVKTCDTVPPTRDATPSGYLRPLKLQSHQRTRCGARPRITRISRMFLLRSEA